MTVPLLPPSHCVPTIAYSQTMGNTNLTVLNEIRLLETCNSHLKRKERTRKKKKDRHKEKTLSPFWWNQVYRESPTLHSVFLNCISISLHSPPESYQTQNFFRLRLHASCCAEVLLNMLQTRNCFWLQLRKKSIRLKTVSPKSHLSAQQQPTLLPPIRRYHITPQPLLPHDFLARYWTRGGSLLMQPAWFWKANRTENNCLLLLFELISNEFLYLTMASHVNRDRTG